MTQPGPIPSDERIVDAMIVLACPAKSHQMIVAGSNSSGVFQGAAATWLFACGNHENLPCSTRPKRRSSHHVAGTLDESPGNDP